MLAREIEEDIPDRLSGGRDQGRLKRMKKVSRRAGKRSTRRRRKDEHVRRESPAMVETTRFSLLVNSRVGWVKGNSKNLKM
jgi:hypothetical protein